MPYAFMMQYLAQVTHIYRLPATLAQIEMGAFVGYLSGYPVTVYART